MVGTPPLTAENEQAPTKKGIKNTVEHESYQCLMTPTGLEEGAQTPANTNALVDSDAKSVAIYQELIQVLSNWPQLPAQVRAEVVALVCGRSTCFAIAHPSGRTSPWRPSIA